MSDNNDDRDCAFAAGILQAPVGKFSKFSDGVWKEVTASSPGMLLYSAPPRKEWVGLTGTEINHIFSANVGYPERMMKEVEVLLKEKNS